MEREPIRIDASRINLVLSFMGLAFKDYIGARTLLNQRIGTGGHLGLTGAVLGSSAVEKYFKACIAVWDTPRRWHLNNDLIEAVKTRNPSMCEKLNPSFIEFLARCYRLRYVDAIEPGFTLHVQNREVLAELDFTVAEIERRFTIGWAGKPIQRSYDAYRENHDPLLWTNNWVLEDRDKKAFVEQRDSAYAMRIDEDMGILECFYDTDDVRAEGEFLKPGFVPVDAPQPGQRSFKLAKLPVGQEPASA